jgi:uncharacterized membrane protein YqiK
MWASPPRIRRAPSSSSAHWYGRGIAELAGGRARHVKYAINPRCYVVEIVPTFILTLNWADATSSAHNLDKDLHQITAKSKEGFVFDIDLQVQIHVPDTEAPKVISIVGTMFNLVNEVLQAAVGNHFRDKLQSMPAIGIEKPCRQEQAQAHHREAHEYMVEPGACTSGRGVSPAGRVLTTRKSPISSSGP